MGDQLTNNLAVVNPDGSISAELQGNLRLPADRVTGLWIANARHSVHWVDLGRRTVAACTGSTIQPNIGEGMQVAYSPDGLGGHALVLELARSDRPSYVRAGAGQGGSAADAILITSDGQSSFLQLAPNQFGRRHVSWGVQSTPGTGARSVSYDGIPHGLGRRPAIVLATTNNGALLAGTLNYTATTFSLVVSSPGLAGWGPGAFVTCWLAIA